VKYLKMQICNVTYTPTGNPLYYESTDDGRLAVSKYLDEIKAHMKEDQQIVISEVSEDEFKSVSATNNWWRIWE
jgi:hypothetical protein